MTVPAKTSDYDFETGLEEFGREDTVIPRLTIVHKEGMFKDSLTGETFDSINVIILGLVKQRSLWHTTVDDNDWPMCRSTDHNTGFPNFSDDQPKEKRFNLLWEKAGFDPKDYPPGPDGQVRLPCASCQLKEWGSHPDGKKPYCSEQFTLALLYDPDKDGTWVPAIMTLQKTSLKPLKAYLSSFARSKSAAFQAITAIGLDMQKRGANEYSVPNFKKIGNTDEDNWREYSTNYRQMADFLRQDPGARDEDAVAPQPSSNVTKAPEAGTVDQQDDGSADIVDAQVVEDKAEQASKVVSESPPAASVDDDDELPF
jgi:hypothetical protein